MSSDEIFFIDFRLSPRILQFVTIAAIVSIVILLWMIFAYAPLEKVMGSVQKIFYIHVAVLWVGMLGFFAAAVTSILYLKTYKERFDKMSVAAIEISTVFFLLGIISGSVWAKPVWNTWWTWDPRLTSAAILELIYFAYFILRQSIENVDLRARYSAIYALLGFVSVPLTFFSIRFMRTIHPVLIAPNEGGTLNIIPPMAHTLLFGIIAFSLLFLCLYLQRIRLAYLREECEVLKVKLYD